MIQEEKESAAIRAEEIECRVGSGDSLGGRFRSMGSLPPSICAGSSLGGSPPGSGQSTPRRIPRSPNREMDRMGVMTLVRIPLLPFSYLTSYIHNPEVHLSCLSFVVQETLISASVTSWF